MRLGVSIVFLCFLVNLLSSQSISIEKVSPETKGFSSEKLDSLGILLDEKGSSSLLILVDGQVVYSWGDIYKRHLVHSIRKSLLNSLIGIHVSKGIIDTNATLLDVGIDDFPNTLNEVEKSARVADLLKSKSGVYLPAAAVTPAMMKSMPERNEYLPGEHFYYNNWDFNALGYILEKTCEKSIFDMFLEEIALPLGMTYRANIQSLYSPPLNNNVPHVDGFYQFELDKSQFPAYHFRLNTLDLAKFGQLYLNEGKWNGVQIIDPNWIQLSTKPYSDTYKPAGLAYGMLWKVLKKTSFRDTRSYYHTGLGVHMLAVYPKYNMVVVHRVDTEKDFEFTEVDLRMIIGKVWEAKVN